MSLSAASREGRKSTNDADCPCDPKKKPDEGIMYEGPGLSHSFAGGTGLTNDAADGSVPVASLYPVLYVSVMV